MKHQLDRTRQSVSARHTDVLGIGPVTTSWLLEFDVPLSAAASR